jgi:hypothetical protein
MMRSLTCVASTFATAEFASAVRTLGFRRAGIQPVGGQNQVASNYPVRKSECRSDTGGDDGLRSIHEPRRRELPCAAQSFGSRAIEPHHLIPARHSRQAIRNLAVAVPARQRSTNNSDAPGDPSSGDPRPEVFVRKSVLRHFYHRLIAFQGNPTFFQRLPQHAV